MNDDRTPGGTAGIGRGRSGGRGRGGRRTQMSQTARNETTMSDHGHRGDQNQHHASAQRGARPGLPTIHEATRVIAFHREGSPRGHTITPSRQPAPNGPNTPPSPLTPIFPPRSRPSGSVSTPTGTNLTRGDATKMEDDKYFPAIPPYPAHPLQHPSPPAALDLLDKLLGRPVSDWTMEDFKSTDTTGTSVLVSLFIDYAHYLHPDGLTTSQRGLLSRTARATHPTRLLTFLIDPDKATSYISSSLESTPPLLRDVSLCPAATADLILNDGLRGRISSPGLTRGDLLQIILPFLKCFYPQDGEMEALIRKRTQTELDELVHTPGAVHTLALTRSAPFTPPTWFILSRSGDKGTGDTQDDQDATLELRPLEHMGMSPTEFAAMPPAQQKAHALSGLYSFLESKLPPKTIIAALVQLGTAPPEDILTLLQPDNFHRLVGLPPPKVPPLPLFRIRLLLQHNGRGGTRYWSTTPGAVIQQWLQALLPALRDSPHLITLTLSPHGTDHREFTIDRDSLPTTDSLQPFAHRARLVDGKFRRLELWLVTSCPGLATDISHTTSDLATTQYPKQLSSSRIWVQQVEKFFADSHPCILLAHSIHRDDDLLVAAELQARLRAANFTDDDIPFFISWGSVSTSDDAHSTMAKCVYTHSLLTTAMTSLFMELPTGPTTELTYPITGKYHMLPLPSVPAKSNDEALRKVIDHQQSFLDSTTYTLISGLPATDWFTTPALSAPVALSMPMPNPTWVQLLQYGQIKEPGGDIQSPVITLSTDATYTRCYLTAYKNDARALVHFTRRLYTIFTSWLGSDQGLSCDVGDARTIARQNEQQDTEEHSRIPDTLQQRVDELTVLVRHLVSRMDSQDESLANMSIPGTTSSSISSTISSASQSALSRCDTFLATLSSRFEAFLRDHSLQLASLYARSNSSDSRDGQLDNLVRAFAVTSSTTEKRTDAFRAAVEENTAQVASLVEEISRISHPAASKDNHLNSATPQLAPPTETDIAKDALPKSTLTDPEGDFTGMDEPTTCAECASHTGDFCTCTICNRLVHPGCLHDESSGTICRTCAATLHSDSDTQGGELEGYSSASPIGSPTLQLSTSMDEDSIANRGLMDTTPKRLSPQGRPTKPATRFTRSAINSSKQSPSYSQSTLSFSSKRASNANITGEK